MERRLAAILAADVAGYSRLMALNEAGTLADLKAHRRELVDPEIRSHGGRVIKLMGDGALVEFASILNAVECAVSIQQGMQRRNAAVPANIRIEFRIGINLGDLIVDGDDLYGDGVNVASRLEGLAEPGGLCVSGTVFDTVEGKLDLTTEDMGAQEVKNIPRPVRVYRVAIPAVPPGQAVASTPGKPSIAVLPFVNMSSDPDQEFFSDGISEDIITDLSKVGNLHVAARNSTFAFKGSAVDLEQAAAKLRVRYVLEGSVRKAGDRVRITAQLIDSRSGGHIWAERYDRKLENIFDLQDEITAQIVETLKVKITPSEERAIERRPTQDVDAYQQYLRGRAFLREMTLKSTEMAMASFRSAVELDPHYARAHAGLAESKCTLAYHYDVAPGVVESAMQDSQRALEIAPDLAEAHASLGWVLELLHRNDEAERHFRRAIELSPRFFEAHFYLGLMHMSAGNFTKAIVSLRDAFEMADHDLQAGMMLMGALDGARDRTGLQEVAPRVFGAAQVRRGLNPGDETAAYVGAFALLGMGEREKAKDWADLAVALASEDNRQRYNLACLLSRLGQVQQAIDQLKLVLAEITANDSKIDYIRFKDPDLESIRGDPRFAALFKG